MMKKCLYIAFVIFVFLAESIAQEVPLPADTQIKLLVKTLEFDRNLSGRSHDYVNIAIFYQKKNRQSNDLRLDIENVIQQFKNSKIQKKSVKFLFIDISSLTDFTDIINSQHIDVAFILPLKSINVNDISNITRQKQIISITPCPEYIKNGVSIGFDMQGGKPQIILNLSNSKKEGTNFSSIFLNYAKVIE